MADWAVHGRPHCVAAVGAGIFKQGTILLHHPVVRAHSHLGRHKKHPFLKLLVQTQFQAAKREKTEPIPVVRGCGDLLDVVYWRRAEARNLLIRSLSEWDEWEEFIQLLASVSIWGKALISRRVT